MSNPIDDGGPAFPCTEGTFDDHGVYFHNGMALRDWFAGMAMQTYIAASSADGDLPARFAEYAYAQADAMIAARNRTP